MQTNQEIIYFEIDNWFSGRDYPNDEIFRKWVAENQFSNDQWCKENKLCVVAGPIDMSMCWCVAAPRAWVEENCPKLLTDEEFTYATITCSWKDGKEIQKREEHTKKYSDFLCYPDEEGDVYGHIEDWHFREYCEENFGVEWNDSWWGDESDDEDAEDDEETEEDTK